jgi:pilus assembly protein Flp/PilA
VHDKRLYLHLPAGAADTGRDCKMRRRITAFLKDESGATAIEYGLIASGIALAIITVLKGLGTNLKTTFGSISTAVK